MKALLLIASLLLLSGCSFTVQILSNNNVLTTRSQTTGMGDADAQVEGGADIEAQVTAIP